MIKQFLKSFDMFTASPTLRVRGETEHASICAGLISFMILMAFGFVFIRDLINLFSYKSISHSESILVPHGLLRDRTARIRRYLN